MILEKPLLFEKYLTVRQCSRDLCADLEVEDYVVQPVTDVSPPKWHLAHTTWFFESFVLLPHKKGYREFHPRYSYIFNSYYETVGDRVKRPNRGFLTRPTVEEVYQYRRYVDEQMEAFLEEQEITDEIAALITVGLQHEQQHQELLLYDLKYILGNNPLFPIYQPAPHEGEPHNGIDRPSKTNYFEVQEGIYEIGHQGEGFCFDNELGRHKVYLHAFQFMDRLVTNEEYLEFMDAGGYAHFKYWLSEGWDWVQVNGMQCPFHWHKIHDKWMYYSLKGGLIPINPVEPVTHVSFFEADAFARWKGKRLLTEFEWEVACHHLKPDMESGNFMESKNFNPMAKPAHNSQFFGDVWEWTDSAYRPYPYYQSAEGALGEYNGKFMINQMVLRGGSCATAKDHIRITYRNFFHPHLQWLFSGIRLAESL